jgi:hypothetical protein
MHLKPSDIEIPHDDWAEFSRIATAENRTLQDAEIRDRAARNRLWEAGYVSRTARGNHATEAGMRAWHAAAGARR